MDIAEKIEERARTLAKDNFTNPSERDVLILTSAMHIGALIAIEHQLEEECAQLAALAAEPVDFRLTTTSTSTIIP